jgi:uncharacterized lipoprotein YmbA
MRKFLMICALLAMMGCKASPKTQKYTVDEGKPWPIAK